MNKTRKNNSIKVIFGLKMDFLREVCICVFECDKKCLLVFGQNLAVAAIVRKNMNQHSAQKMCLYFFLIKQPV